jgi:hypothetical protein
MRVSSIALGLVLAAACSKREAPPVLPEAPAANADVEETVEAPTLPTPAFVPSEQGACARAYRRVDDTCVHRFYEGGSELALQAALAAYKRGAAPPMLGPVLLPSKPELRQARKPNPGSLMRKGANLADAGSTKDQRLAELDAMLSLAREKLAKRDEESKAKKVENAPRAARPTQANTGVQQGADSFAQGMAGLASTSGSAGSSDPETARMGELSRLANQLSGDQLKALTSELGKTGFNAGALEAILSEARDEHKAP